MKTLAMISNHKRDHRALQQVLAQLLADVTRPFKPKEEPAAYLGELLLRSCRRCTLDRSSPSSSSFPSRTMLFVHHDALYGAGRGLLTPCWGACSFAPTASIVQLGKRNFAGRDWRAISGAERGRTVGIRFADRDTPR